MNIEKTAVNAAKKAGFLLKENLGKVKAEFKGATDIVTEADRKADRLITGEIHSAFPGHGILTEESAEIKSPSPYKWIIDPLDGTTNYSHGFPFFCVSIGFEEHGAISFGVIYDPMRDELFTAEKGKGAYLNGNRIRVSGADALDRSLLSTDFPYDTEAFKRNIGYFSASALKAQAVRITGSAALGLAYTACGRFDAYWNLFYKPWDVAAATLVMEEAGGLITDFSGNPFSIYGEECAAGNALVHAEMLKNIRKV